MSGGKQAPRLRDRVPSVPDRGVEESPLSRDTVFSVLSSRRRRLALYYLWRVEGEVSIQDVATQIAVWENDVAEPELTYKQRKRVYTSLHQTHFPKLEDAGVIEYDRNHGNVVLTDRAEQLDRYLGVVDAPYPRWSLVYLGVAMTSLAVVGLAWAGVSPFAQVPDLAYGWALAACLLVCSTINYVAGRRSSGTLAPSEFEDVVEEP